MMTDLTDGAVAQNVLNAMSAANVGYAITDRAGVILQCSDGYRRLTEIDESFSTDPVIWYNSDQSSDVIKRERFSLWHRFLAEGKNWQGVVRWRLKNGKMRYFEGTAITQADDTVILFVSEKSRLVEANRDLGRAQHFQDQALQSLPIVIAVCDTNGKILFSTPYLGRRLNYNVGSELGQQLTDFYGSKLGELGEASQELLDRVVKTGRPVVRDIVEVTTGPLPNTHWYATARPLLDHRGQVGQIMIVLIDRTDNIRLREERIEFANAIHESQKISALNNFAGNLAHELANLLQPIAGYARLINQKSSHDQSREYADKITQAALTAGEILRRTLAMTHRDTASGPVTDVTTVVADVVASARDLAPVSMSYDLQSSKDVKTAACPKNELQQVLLNLLNNAAEAMGYDGSISLSVCTQDFRPTPEGTAPAGSPPYVTVSVKDSGPGIPKDVRDRIFEPFFTTKPEGRGTGLGLAIVNSLVQNWGGIVVVDSPPDAGSRFTLWIPTRTEDNGPGDKSSPLGGTV